MGSAIVHWPPLPPVPGYSITIGGTFDLYSQSPGHCADGQPQDPCSFVFVANMWFDVQPPGTPTQGDLCLTQQGGTVKLLCGAMAIPEAPPGSGHYPIVFPALGLQSTCGTGGGWTIGFWYEWFGILAYQPVITANVTCSGCGG